MFLNIILLVGLIRLFIATNRPFLCSSIYTSLGVFHGVGALLAGSEGMTVFHVVLAVTIRFALSSLYFGLLYWAGEGLLWWVILVLGLLIGLV